MAGTNPEDVAKRLRDAFAAYNRHDLEPYLAMMDPDYVAYDPSSPEPIIRGREAARKANEGLFKSFPDLQFRILSIAVSGDVAAGEFVMSGTFKGVLEVFGRPIPPTGRHLELRGATFFRVNSKGLLAEGRNYYDTASMFQQLDLKA